MICVCVDLTCKCLSSPCLADNSLGFFRCFDSSPVVISSAEWLLLINSESNWNPRLVKLQKPLSDRSDYLFWMVIDHYVDAL